ncbi:MAG TPA: VOC family protein [Parvularculaceae bacterium]|nr:VOC family protein [Parvularculaceae bacterium]HNS85833.1 VOC family protein [Parvularculaceae bacterium]
MTPHHRISTCLWFDDNGEEAANFYVSLFPNSRIVSVSRYGEGGMMRKGLAMLTRFELDGVPYGALNGGPHFKLSEAASIVALCDTQGEIDRLWAALTANGGAESRCGWLKDHFGLSWQVIPSLLNDVMAGDQTRVDRVMAAIMPMTKIDLAAIEAALNS